MRFSLSYNEYFPIQNESVLKLIKSRHLNVGIKLLYLTSFEKFNCEKFVLNIHS